MNQFNTFVEGDHWIQNAQVFGRVAIGGDLNAQPGGNITIGSDEPNDPNRFDLIVRGNIKGGNSTMNSTVNVPDGSVIHGGMLAPTVSITGGAVVDTGSPRLRVPTDSTPIDFTDTFLRLRALQSAWADLTDQKHPDLITTGEGSADHPIVRFVGTHNDRNVFTVSAETLQTAAKIQIRAPRDTTTTLINVTGASGYKWTNPPTGQTEFAVGSGGFNTVGGGIGGGVVNQGIGLLRSRLVWSFPGVEGTVQIGAGAAEGPETAWEGSIFAPYKTVLVGTSAIVNGTIVAMRLEQAEGGDVRLPGLGEGVCLPKQCPESPEELNGEPEPTPSPSPTPSPVPTPPPSPSPTPSPVPTPPPLPDQPIELAPPGPAPPPDTGFVAGTLSGPTSLKMCKRPFRPRVRAGSRVTFRLEVRNIGLARAQRVVVCDRVSASVRIVRAPGAQIRGRRACWRIASVRDERTVHLTVRVNSRARGVIRNVVTGRAANADPARAVAQIRVTGPPPVVTG